MQIDVNRMTESFAPQTQVLHRRKQIQHEVHVGQTWHWQVEGVTVTSLKCTRPVLFPTGSINSTLVTVFPYILHVHHTHRDQGLDRVLQQTWRSFVFESWCVSGQITSFFKLCIKLPIIFSVISAHLPETSLISIFLSGVKGRETGECYGVCLARSEFGGSMS